MEFLLKYNLFEFHSATWRQEIATAMGVHPAPSYKNIDLARRIDKYVTDLSKNYQKGKASCYSSNVL